MWTRDAGGGILGPKTAQLICNSMGEEPVIPCSQIEHGHRQRTEAGSDIFAQNAVDARCEHQRTHAANCGANPVDYFGQSFWTNQIFTKNPTRRRASHQP